MKHNFELRVYYEDTDCMGIVYYANYLRFAERARSEYLRSGGFQHFSRGGRATQNQTDNMPAFVVRRCNLRFLRPAQLHDWLRIETNSIVNANIRSLIQKNRLTMVDMRQDIYHETNLLVTLQVNLAFIDQDGKACHLPQDIASYFGLKI